MKNGQKKASGVWRKTTALGAVLLVALAGSAMAGQATEKAAPLAGVQAHVDPATGQLRQPDAAEVKALADALRARFATRSIQAAQVTQHADGSISAMLGPDHRIRSARTSSPSSTRTWTTRSASGPRAGITASTTTMARTSTW